MDCTTPLASSAESTTWQSTPLRSSSVATALICSREATIENCATASSLGPGTAISPGWSIGSEEDMSFTAHLRQTLMDQRNRHGSLADGRSAALDGSAPDVASSKEPREIRLERNRRTGQWP